MEHKTRPTIISFLAAKGGVGKSTACLSLAGAIAKNGHKVHILDFDQNETIWTWYAGHPSARAIENITVEKAPRVAPDEYVEKLYCERKGGAILIDMAGHLDELMMVVAALSDLVIIPTKLGVSDIIQAMEVARKVAAYGASLRKPITTRILLNEIPFTPSRSQKSLLTQLGVSGLPCFETELHFRPYYGEPLSSGVPLHFEAEPNESIQKAVIEIDKLLAETVTALATTEQRKAA